eukprot:PhF_6_TR39880/c0_g1_i1/m.59293
MRKDVRRRVYTSPNQDLIPPPSQHHPSSLNLSNTKSPGASSQHTTMTLSSGTPPAKLNLDDSGLSSSTPTQTPHHHQEQPEKQKMSFFQRIATKFSNNASSKRRQSVPVPTTTHDNNNYENEVNESDLVQPFRPSTTSKKFAAPTLEPAMKNPLLSSNALTQKSLTELLVRVRLEAYHGAFTRNGVDTLDDLRTLPPETFRSVVPVEADRKLLVLALEKAIDISVGGSTCYV